MLELQKAHQFVPMELYKAIPDPEKLTTDKKLNYNSERLLFQHMGLHLRTLPQMPGPIGRLILYLLQASMMTQGGIMRQLMQIVQLTPVYFNFQFDLSILYNIYIGCDSIFGV